MNCHSENVYEFKNNWEKGRCEMGDFRDSGFGEAFVALNKKLICAIMHSRSVLVLCLRVIECAKSD